MWIWLHHLFSVCLAMFTQVAHWEWKRLEQEFVNLRDDSPREIMNAIKFECLWVPSLSLEGTNSTPKISKWIHNPEHLFSL